MKKTLSLFLLLLLLLSFPVSAVSGRLSAPSVSGSPGEQVTVTVRLDNPGIVATRIFVRYDSAVLRLDSAENGDVFAKSCAVFGKDVSADPYTMLWDDSLRTDNVTASGTLCTFRFTIRKTAETGETGIRIAVDKASTFDVNLNEVTVADTTCIVKTGGAAAETTKPTSTAATAAPTTGSSRPSASATAKTSGTTTKPTAATSTTAKPTVASSTASSTASPATTSAVSSATSSTTPSATSSAASLASSAAASSSMPAPKEENGTTALQTVPDIGTTVASAEPAADDADTAEQSDAFTEAASFDTTDSSGVLTIGATDQNETRRVNLLWLLVLVPVAAVLMVVIFKKKK